MAIDSKNISKLVAEFRNIVVKDQVSPDSLGYLLDRIVAFVDTVNIDVDARVNGIDSTVRDRLELFSNNLETRLAAFESDIVKQTQDSFKSGIFQALWDNACGEYGRYNKDSGLYELNGITDIPFEEALNIYSAYSDCVVQREGFAHVKGRTNIPFFARWDADIRRYAQMNSYAQVIHLPVSLEDAAYMDLAFYGCTNLKSITGLSLHGGKIDPNTFYNCVSLITLQIYGLCCDLDISYSEDISYQSLKYLVQCAANERPINIYLHEYVLERVFAKADNLSPDEIEKYSSLRQLAQTQQVNFLKRPA